MVTVDYLVSSVRLDQVISKIQEFFIQYKYSIIFFLASRKLFPQCYYSRDDIMVLEDLTLQYRHLKPTECYSFEHYKLVLEHLAALHAASIAWEEAEQFYIGDRYKKVFNELLMNMQNEWFITGLKVRNPYN